MEVKDGENFKTQFGVRPFLKKRYLLLDQNLRNSLKNHLLFLLSKSKDVKQI